MPLPAACRLAYDRKGNFSNLSGEGEGHLV